MMLTSWEIHPSLLAGWLWKSCMGRACWWRWRPDLDLPFPGFTTISAMQPPYMITFPKKQDVWFLSAGFFLKFFFFHSWSCIKSPACLGGSGGPGYRHAPVFQKFVVLIVFKVCVYELQKSHWYFNGGLFYFKYQWNYSKNFVSRDL